MSVSGIQGQILEVTVVGCNKLKDTEWISRQDPYVCVEYGSSKFRTRTCTDGGKTPTFQEKYTFTLIEGLREVNLVVWNSNTLSFDDFIGSGKAQLQKVLTQGYDDSTWSIQTKTGRYAGEVRLIMHYANANTNVHKPPKNYAPSAPPYVAPQAPQASYYAPPASAAPYSTAASAAPYPSPSAAYPQSSPYQSYPPASTSYPPSPYHPPQPTTYPPQPYPPPSAYPPPPYPPPSQPSPFFPPGHYPGMYPPPY